MRQNQSRLILSLLVLLLTTIACVSNSSYVVLVTATPLSINSGGGGVSDSESGGNAGQAPAGASPLPLDPNVVPTPTFIPTPNPTRAVAINSTEEQIYIVTYGDTLGIIAQRFSVTVESIVEVNSLANENILSVGQALIIPTAIQTMGPSFKIIPDSELVYGPALKDFSVKGFMQGRDSFLNSYTEDMDGVMWTGTQIVERVALEQSISPRLLLAILEHESGWISRGIVTDIEALYPLNYQDRPTQIYGLYGQLTWGAMILQTGYYGWRQRGLSATLLTDGTRAGFNPTINAGTAGVQMLLSQTRTNADWQLATQHTGLFWTYVTLFGDPFQYAVEPLIPPDLQQPPIGFPWAAGTSWYYTGGPHGGWGQGSAWAALDFVPADETKGCELPDSYAAAVADGVIARSEMGLVILDLDGDGYEGTGWTIFYLHLSTTDRLVVEGQRVKKGDPIGKPSCEGGVSYSSHLHIGRRYNGEWIAADCSSCLLDVPAPPFVMDGWLATTYGTEYNGGMIKGKEEKEACTCREDWNVLAQSRE